MAISGDYIYSGHTIVLVVSSLFINHCKFAALAFALSSSLLIADSPRNWRILHYTSAIASTIGVLCLLLSRGHYTVDVIIGRLEYVQHNSARVCNTNRLVCATHTLGRLQPII